jgi:hypothetical protein
MDEIPDHPVIHPQTTLGKFSDQPAQREVVLDPLQQPQPVRAGDRLRPVTADLARRNAAGLTQPLHPLDGSADAHPELLRCPIA